MAGNGVGSFLGADVDGLDKIGQTMDQAEELANTVTAILEALATALEAMSWTGFAAAFAAFLRSTVIPWVKFAAKVFGFFSKIIKLASGDQKQASGDSPTVDSGNVSYTPPTMPTTSCGDAPRLQPVQVTITINTQGSDTGVQVGSPQLPGAVGTTPLTNGSTGGSSSGSALPAGVSGSTPSVVNPDGSPATVSTGGGGATAPIRTSSGGVDGGSAGGSSGGASGGPNPSFSAGISTNPNGGLDYNASIRGTIGGDPSSSAATPVGGAGGGSSLDGGGVTGSTSPQGGVSPALIAAPLGAAGLAAAAAGAKGLGSGSGSVDGARGSTDGAGSDGSAAGAAGAGAAGAAGAGATGAAGAGAAGAGTAGAAGTGAAGDPAGAGATAATPSWRLVALQESDGSLDFAFAPDTDAAPVAADLAPVTGADGTAAADDRKVVGWIDGDGDYGFTGEDVTVSTPTGEVTVDAAPVEGVLGEDQETTEAVTGWWEDALEGATADATTPADPGTTPDVPSPTQPATAV